ncbi:MAG: HEAT repeat domain-containing protein [Planctomycetota bacterium]|jgi:hypothetical protein
MKGVGNNDNGHRGEEEVWEVHERVFFLSGRVMGKAVYTVSNILMWPFARMRKTEHPYTMPGRTGPGLARRRGVGPPDSAHAAMSSPLSRYGEVGESEARFHVARKRDDAAVRTAVEDGRLADAILALNELLKQDSDRLEFALQDIHRLFGQILRLKKELDEMALRLDPTADAPSTRDSWKALDEKDLGFGRGAAERRATHAEGTSAPPADDLSPSRALGRAERKDPGFKSLSERLIAQEALRDLETPDKEVKLASLSKLGKMRQASLLPVFLRHLGADDPRIRSECVKAAAATREASVLPMLGRVFAGDSSDLVRITSLRCLCEFIRSGAAPPDMLIDALVDESPLVRASAARYAGWTDVQEALPYLFLMLKDPSADVRKSTVETLELLDSPQAVEPLVDVLDDEAPEVRKRAAKALRHLTGTSPAPDEADEKAAWMNIVKKRVDSEG